MLCVYAGCSDLGVSFILNSLLISMSRRCLAKMSLYSTRISSMSFLFPSLSCEFVYLKMAKKVATIRCYDHCDFSVVFFFSLWFGSMIGVVFPFWNC